MPSEVDSDEDVIVELGVITRPHGVRGEVRVHPHNPDSEILDRVGSLLRLDVDPPTRIKVVSSRRGPKVFLLRFEGVSTCEAAELLRGVPIGVLRSEFPEPEDDEVYLIDLIGLEVRRDGEAIGRVTEIFEYPSVDCLEIETAEGTREVPFMPPWVAEVDVEAGYVVVGDIEDIPLVEPQGGKRGPSPRDA